MDDQEQKKVFSRNLTRLLTLSGKTQREVAESIHVLPSTFNTWCQGVALPRMGKVQLLADYFGVAKSALIDDAPASTPPPLTSHEQEHIRKYRRLDEKGQHAVDVVTDMEYVRVVDEDRKKAAPASAS